jgi:hypothetical protein
LPLGPYEAIIKYEEWETVPKGASIFSKRADEEYRFSRRVVKESSFGS